LTAADESKKMLSASELNWANARGRVAETLAAKTAILEALGLSKEKLMYWNQLQIWLQDEGRVCVKLTGEVQTQAWSILALDYKAAFTASSDQIFCTAAAIADPADLMK